MITINSSDIVIQTAKIRAKMDKYPAYVTGIGTEAVNSYLNEDQFKGSMYPQSQSGAPFVWSSERQRRAFFATNGFGGGIPTKRTGYLHVSGYFRVDKTNAKSMYILYGNVAPYAKWVYGYDTQIIGHKTRGWLAPSAYVVKYRAQIVDVFEKATNGAWDAMDVYTSGVLGSIGL